MLNTRNSQHLGLLNQQIAFGIITAEIFTTKVENVYLPAGLLRLISLVDLTFSIISLILKSSTMAPRKISKYLQI